MLDSGNHCPQIDLLKIWGLRSLSTPIQLLRACRGLLHDLLNKSCFSGIFSSGLDYVPSDDASLSFAAIPLKAAAKIMEACF
jgi:hypothetical protein